MKTLRALVLLVTALALCGCAQTGQHASSASSPSTSPVPRATASIYVLTDSELQECNEHPLIDRIAAEEKDDQTAVGSRLALPDDMPGATKAQIAAQRKAWESLSNDDRLFQLCLRAADAGELKSLIPQG